MSLEAVVFDFDGLILDTEWPIYEMAAAAFAGFGVDVSVAEWAAVVGLADVDHEWFHLLRERLGFDIDFEDFNVAYYAQDRSVRDRLEPLAGVVALIDSIGRNGFPLAIASSSDLAWIENHLLRVGLLGRFGVIVGVDHVEVGGLGKPDPAVYRTACRLLGVAPDRTVALEDSAHGVASAKAAGLLAVAVPNRITCHSSFAHADLLVDSLAQVTVTDLAALVD